MTSAITTSKMMLYSTAILALIASCALSVDAIRCHQCNSHLEEDCIELRLNTPNFKRDNQYLLECGGEHSAASFCRKTVVTIITTGEHRIERGCGWERDSLNEEGDVCFTADNEGYFQTICSCAEDGCNGAPQLGGASTTMLLGMAIVGVLAASLLRRSG